MTFTTEEVRELIKNWDMQVIMIDGKETLRAQPRNQSEVDKYWEHIKANKDIFIAEVKRVEAEKAEHEANIKAIEGLGELEDAINAGGNYHHERNKRMEDEMLSSIAPAKPKVSVQKLKAKYPRAAAYIKAESWSYSNNIGKYNAGRKALERIIAGEDYERVMMKL